MRILTNYSRKVSTAQYENEMYTVTIEMDADMSLGMVQETTDALFSEAKAAVERQLQGNSSSSTPASVTPISKASQGKQVEAPAETKPTKPAGTALPPTEKQLNMVKKLLRENFRNGEDAKRWMQDKFGADNTTALTRKVASRVIDALLDRQRNVA